MNWIEKKCFEELDLFERPTIDPVEWFKRNAMFTLTMCFLIILKLPTWILIKVIKAICFIPYAVYEKLDEL